MSPVTSVPYYSLAAKTQASNTGDSLESGSSTIRIIHGACSNTGLAFPSTLKDLCNASKFLVHCLFYRGRISLPM